MDGEKTVKHSVRSGRHALSVGRGGSKQSAEAQLSEQPGTTAVGAGGPQLCWGLRLHWGLPGASMFGQHIHRDTTGRARPSHLFIAAISPTFNYFAFYYSRLFPFSPVPISLSPALSCFSLTFSLLPSSRVAQQSFDHFSENFPSRSCQLSSDQDSWAT